MHSVRLNEAIGKFELLRNRDGRVLDSAPATNGPLAFYLAFRFGRKHPHLAQYGWNAAALVQAGAVEMVAAGRRRTSSHYDHTRTEMARVSSQSDGGAYVVYKAIYESDTPSAPVRTHYGCTCDHWQKGQGRRPVVDGQAYCKHILAVTIAQAVEAEAAKWEALRRDDCDTVIEQHAVARNVVATQEPVAVRVVNAEREGRERRAALAVAMARRERTTREPEYVPGTMIQW